VQEFEMTFAIGIVLLLVIIFIRWNRRKIIEPGLCLGAELRDEWDLPALHASIIEIG
jgi:hypothetical protein